MRVEYDQGTLLLKDVPPGWQSPEPDLLLWDERVGLFRAKGRRYAELLRSLRPIEDRVAPAHPRVLGKWAPIPLRPYQETARDEWKEAGNRGIVVLPTGAGKTRLALAIASATSSRTLCLVPTRALLEQWQREVRRFYDGPIGIQGDGTHTIEAVTLSTYESAYRGIAAFGNRFDLLIVDECHHFGTGLRDEILEMATAPRRLGLTATLPAAEDWIARLEKLVGPPVFELTLGDLAGTYLADFDSYTLSVDLDPGERFRYGLEMSVYRRSFTQFRDHCPDGAYLDWVRFAAQSEEGRSALQAFQRARKVVASSSAKLALLGRLLERHWGKKILVFTADTEVAYRVSREHLMMPITSEIGRKERERMLAAFREGRIRALVSCRVLNEGMDVPDAEVVLGGTQGEREHIQRVGRILRPSPGKRAVVYQLVCRGTSEVRQSATRSRALAAPVASAL